MSFKVAPERVAAALAEAQDPSLHPSFSFPWSGLEDHLRATGQDAFWLLGYGSLLSVASAARTIDTSERACRVPALAIGGRRLFSYRIPQAFLAKRYGVTDGTRYSALDCKATYSPEDLLNGILTRVFLDDLDAFRDREFAYSLKPLPVFEWDRPETPHRIAYALDCPESSTLPDHPFARDIPPQPEYYLLCREGAASISPEFLEAYLDSTYLGDGVTSVRDWEKSDPSIKSRL